MDKRVIKTKMALRTALFQLLENESIDAITVTKLCEQAGISRRTFYMNYERVTDIFEDYTDDLALKVYQALGTEHVSSEKLLQVFSEILFDNLTGFRYLCLNDAHHGLVDQLRDMLVAVLVNQLEPNYQTIDNQLVIEYMCDGLINNYVYWFRHEPEIEFATLTRMNQKLSKKNIGID